MTRQAAPTPSRDPLMFPKQVSGLIDGLLVLIAVPAIIGMALFVGGLVT